jgi:hypothetical protein
VASRVAGAALALLAAVLLVGTLGAAPAHAFAEPPFATQPISTATDAALKTAIQTGYGTTDMSAFEAAGTYGEFAGEGAAAQAGTSRAAAAGRLLPGMSRLGTIGLGVSAFTAGWYIGATVNKYFHISSSISGTTQSMPVAVTGFKWQYGGTAPWCTVGSAFDIAIGGKCAVAAWRPLLSTTSTPDAHYVWRESGGFYGTIGLGAVQWLSGLTGGIPGGGMAPAGGIFYDLTSSGCLVGGSGACGTRIMTDADMNDQSTVTPETPAQYNLETNKYNAPGGDYVPPAYTGGDATAIRNKLQTGGRPARDFINWIINPGYGLTPSTFTLPAPEWGETVEAYRTRLQAAGYLGTITLLEATGETAIPELGTSAPIKIQVTGTGTGTYLMPRPVAPYDPPGDAEHPWPSPAPELPNDGVPGDGITITHNGPDIPPYIGDPGSPGDPDCPCTVAALDFGPLSGIDTGDSFPFGVFGFVGDVFGPFNVAGDAPVFDFTLDCPALAGCDTYEFGPVDLDVMDDYMTIVRGLLTVLLWIGAVWLVAVKLLGFKAGGDLTDGVDDGSVA